MESSPRRHTHIKRWYHRLYKYAFFLIKRRLRGETHRQWIERNMKDSDAGVVFDILQFIFSFLMVVSIMSQNWKILSFQQDVSANPSIDMINFIAISFSLLLRGYAAPNRLEFCRRPLSLVDIGCWVALITQLTTPHHGSLAKAVRENRYVFRLFLVVRITRILHVFRLLRLAKTAKTRQGILIGMTAACIIIFAAATFQTLEYCYPGYNTACQDLSLFDSMYFVCITVGTVGYGEFAPKSDMGKLACIALIITTGILIPTQISAYTEILNRETAFDKKYIHDKRINHILVCGDVDNGSLSFFLHHWLYSNGGHAHRRKVIILSPELPSPSLRRILIHRQYEQHVVYLQGSAMDTTDLSRACVSTASACFVLTKKGNEVMSQWDTATNLITCSIRKANGIAPLTVQVAKVENIHHFSISGASSITCIEQLKLSLLGKSLWMKGFNALIGNLIHPFMIDTSRTDFWLYDYTRGCNVSIYEATIPECLTTMSTFRALAILIYREFQVPIIGIRTKGREFFLYPVAQKLVSVDIWSVFVLATSNEIIGKIERLTSLIFQRHLDIAPPMLPLTTSFNSAAGLRALTQAFTPIKATSSRSGTSYHRNTVCVPHISSPSVKEESFHHDSSSTDILVPKSSTLPQSPGRRLLHPFTSKGESYVIPTELVELASPPSIHIEPPPPLSKQLTMISHGTTHSPHILTLEPMLSNSHVIPLPDPMEKTIPTIPPIDTTLHSSPQPNEPTPSIESPPSRNPPFLRRSMSHSSFDSLNGSSQRMNQPSSPTPSHQNQRISVQYRSFKRRSPPPDLSNHYVVCGIPTNYTELIKNLTQDTPPAIVFVRPRELTETDFNVYLLHQNIYFVRGSPVNSHVFEQARMIHAHGILILANCGAETHSEQRIITSEPEHTDENMADVDAITSYRFISESCHNAGIAYRQQHGLVHNHSGPHIVVEMMRPSNVKFLNELNDIRGGTTRKEYDEREISNQFHTREFLKTCKGLDESLFSSLYSGGHIYFTNFIDALLGAATHHGGLLDIVTLLISDSNNPLSLLGMIPQTHLSQLPVPKQYHDAPYGVLVEGLLIKENIMVLGLYREAHGRDAPAFVYTNPPREEIVHAQDLIFVIK